MDNTSTRGELLREEQLHVIDGDRDAISGLLVETHKVLLQDGILGHGDVVSPFFQHPAIACESAEVSLSTRGGNTCLCGIKQQSLSTSSALIGLEGGVIADTLILTTGREQLTELLLTGNINVQPDVLEGQVGVVDVNGLTRGKIIVLVLDAIVVHELLHGHIHVSDVQAGGIDLQQLLTVCTGVCCIVGSVDTGAEDVSTLRSTSEATCANSTSGLLRGCMVERLAGHVSHALLHVGNSLLSSLTTVTGTLDSFLMLHEAGLCSLTLCNLVSALQTGPVGRSRACKECSHSIGSKAQYRAFCSCLGDSCEG